MGLSSVQVRVERACGKSNSGVPLTVPFKMGLLYEDCRTDAKQIKLSLARGSLCIRSQKVAWSYTIIALYVPQREILDKAELALSG